MIQFENVIFNKEDIFLVTEIEDTFTINIKLKMSFLSEGGITNLDFKCNREEFEDKCNILREKLAK